ncbi:MAG: hypothetical protein M0P70_13385 [Desulfobulbaceae bacterium]|nr:hypothetical protein [Desulfobulbaceae bacterium]
MARQKLSAVGFLRFALVWAAMCMAAALFPALAVAGQQGLTPPVGSDERQAIADALRQEVKALHGLDVKFVITQLQVKDNWAWIQIRPQSPGGENSYEDIAALLRKVNGVWRLCELACTEPDNPDCLGEPEYFRRLQLRFPEAPREIFPGF